MDQGSDFRSLSSSLYYVVRRWVFLRKVLKPSSAPSLLILDFFFLINYSLLNTLHMSNNFGSTSQEKEKDPHRSEHIYGE